MNANTNAATPRVTNDVAKIITAHNQSPLINAGKKPKKNVVVYAACSGSAWTYDWGKGSNLEKLHKKAYKRCTKAADGYSAGECFLFSVNHTIVWQTKMAKEIKHNEGKYVSGGSYGVYPDKPGFIKY